MNDLKLKLEEAEALAVEAIQELKKFPEHSTSKLRPKVWDSLSAIRRSLQILNEASDTPEVERFGFSQDFQSRLNLSEGKVEDHESYGVISVTKPQGRLRLAGSMVESLPTCIELRIHRAHRIIDSDLSTEHWFPDNKKPLLSLRLSNYQWAEAISSMNGVGVPCTIKDVLGVSMDEPPEEAKTPLEQISDDAKAKAQTATVSSGADFLKALDNLSQQIESLKLSKKKTEEIQAAIKSVGQRFHTRPMETAAWVSQRLAEDSEKLVSQAKVEIAAALSTVFQKAGLSALKDKFGLKEADLTPQLKGSSK